MDAIFICEECGDTLFSYRELLEHKRLHDFEKGGNG